MSPASRTKLLILVAVLLAAVCVALYLLPGTCTVTRAPQRPVEDCANREDDDGDHAVDCMDLDCLGDPVCRRTASWRPDAGAVQPTDDADEAPTATSDGGEVAADDAGRSRGERYCTADSGVCVWDCETDLDCAIAIDMMSCCGGHPHEGESGEIVVCPTAVHRARLDEDPCVFAHVPGMSAPRPPRMCRPICSGLVCGPCHQVSRAVCRGSECVGEPAGACAGDDECLGGQTCVDPDGDGFGTCIAGTHECATNDECVAAHPECHGGCYCVDSDVDGLRDCACQDCPDGRCSVDSQCSAHEYCIDHTCVFSGDDACRMTMWDCPTGFTCESGEGNPSRGTCVPVPRPDERR